MPVTHDTGMLSLHPARFPNVGFNVGLCAIITKCGSSWGVDKNKKTTQPLLATLVYAGKGEYGLVKRATRRDGCAGTYAVKMTSKKGKDVMLQAEVRSECEAMHTVLSILRRAVMHTCFVSHPSHCQTHIVKHVLLTVCGEHVG